MRELPVRMPPMRLQRRGSARREIFYFAVAFAAIIAAGGDTDTNASLAGQIAGALLGPHHLPPELLQKLARVDGYAWVNNVLQIAQQHVV